ncbi:MAG TPA: lysophospholipid acyltransferase family protein [Alphaproteobacteria bacterium]|nr:lysophospholipid acyltransferase family protein [Alphaproteobacteria bacterium]HNS44628.1 lysophospholipid acyltransferase family protein [Alphaproteobacteria bacterium]
MSSFFAILKILALAVWTLPLTTLQIILLVFYKGKGAYYIPRLWHKGVCAITGLKTEIGGHPIHGKQVIYVSNHLSYLDVPVIGSYLLASFVAKLDVAGWPVMGALAKVQQTAFISRNSSHAKKVAGALDTMLQEGKSLILFPEGTSSAGTSLLPFKSSLFSLVIPKEESHMTPVPIQPFVLELISVNGTPPTPQSRDLYSWYGEMDFAPHIWEFLKNRGATVRLTFLAPVTPTIGQDRKELCRIVQDEIQTGLPVSDAV